MKVIVHFESSKIDSSSIAELYECVGFGLAKDYLSVENFEKRFLGGGNIFSVFATTITDRLVGIARVFSDDMFVTYVTEVCVHPDVQRQGVGTALVRAVVRRFQHTAIFTEALTGSEKLFGAVGITPKRKLVACSRAPGPLEV
jgi:ribosomal protein S18 acetylase RimI-like enzyme